LSRRFFVGAVVGAALLLPAASALSDWAEIGRDALVRATPEILAVRVVSIDTEMKRFPGNAHPIPARHVRAAVLESYRGGRAAGDEVEFFVPGGVAPDGTEVSVSTMPAIEGHAGREALVFLAPGGPFAPVDEGSLGLPDGAHGLYAIERPGKSGPRVVRARTGSPIPRDLALDAFAAEARAILAAAGEGRPR